MKFSNCKKINNLLLDMYPCKTRQAIELLVKLSFQIDIDTLMETFKNWFGSIVQIGVNINLRMPIAVIRVDTRSFKARDARTRQQF